MAEDPTSILGHAQSMTRAIAREQAQGDIQATARAEWDAKTRATDVRLSLAARWKRLTGKLTAAWTAKPGPDDGRVEAEVEIK